SGRRRGPTHSAPGRPRRPARSSAAGHAGPDARAARGSGRSGRGALITSRARAGVLGLAAIAASAAAFALYARVDWPSVVLGWCGLGPGLAALDRAPTLGRALGSAWLMCEAFSVAVFFWFAQAIATYVGAPLAVGLLVLVLLAPLLQPQFFAFAAARHLL